MKLNFVGKGILPVGVVLLSLAMLGQPALAEDDDEQGYDEQSYTGQLIINSWCADFGVAQSIIRIWGQNFGDEEEADDDDDEQGYKVTLDDVVLIIVSWADNEIVAELPDALDEDHTLCVYRDEDDRDCCVLAIPPWSPSPRTGLVLTSVPVFMTAEDAAIAIPNLIEARKSGNEAGAIGALKTITTSANLVMDDWGFASCEYDEFTTTTFLP